MPQTLGEQAQSGDPGVGEPGEQARHQITLDDGVDCRVVGDEERRVEGAQAGHAQGVPSAGGEEAEIAVPGRHPLSHCLVPLRDPDAGGVPGRLDHDRPARELLDLLGEVEDLLAGGLVAVVVGGHRQRDRRRLAAGLRGAVG